MARKYPPPSSHHLSPLAHTTPPLAHSGPNPLKVAILLEKLGLSYEVIPLDFSNDAQNGVKGSKFLAVNPNGRVPALVDHQNGDLVIWESGAILFYLVEQYDKVRSESVCGDQSRRGADMVS